MANINDTFAHLGLNSLLVKALNNMGYTKPSPIQEICIPYLLKGRDVLGMAQTGSGKTAAFSLPLLHNIQLNLKAPQILVLTPTRELAVQVAEAFTDFSKYMKGVIVLALYGGQRYDVQLKGLTKGPQIVVGTPGRLLDHLKRKTLILSKLSCIVLDEADEMLRMGFLEDVENIMNQIPKNHQTALFSATMPELIRRISRRFMKTPKEIKIQSNVTNCPDIKQSFWIVNRRKTDALVRFLEVEDFSATIIFVRTKNATLEISESLEKSGYNSAALNGDMNQSVREQTLEKLKDGRLDILIATDVAARGLDVDRISLVINYDIPMDAESYIHRIGRTGRAGRKGKALLFVEHRERRLLRNIERIVKFNISEVNLPKNDLLVERRLKKISEVIQKELQSKDLEKYRNLLPKLYPFSNHLKIENLAAVLLKMAQGDRPLIIPPELIRKSTYHTIKMKENKKYLYNKNNKFNNFNRKFINNNVDLYRIEVGRNDGVEVRHIVGAVANEGNIDSSKIGNVKLFPAYATIELSKGLSKDLLCNFKNTRILNKLIRIKLLNNLNRKERFISNKRCNRFEKSSNSSFFKKRL
ncbi:ATP-dependent RNA helicase [Buchnera aphidicola (Nipponaphis monzeni)]|uniref:ATP-dependent RNA helicase DeaD n=1 Tax=Buchnera aphidicola (Nipponaphis monzeni) TaxID=2495405 RepID=A0A455TAE7_9GAMM|nr:DEAD/DEAH box helicase [Buchnera aphidicola]BBI01293.1 ATP-dependent RNA helicase [Buchnera aphidicola (Nipponaphis monzeni)]